MNIRRVLRTIAGKAPLSSPKHPRTPGALRGGRVTVSHDRLARSLYGMAPPVRSENLWQLRDWTEEDLLHLPVDRFMKLVTSLSPEVAKAYTDFLRHANAAWGYRVEPKGATPIIDSFFQRLRHKYHDADVIIDRIYAGIYKGGAIFFELVLNDTADSAEDIAVLDPYLARFRRVGDAWHLGQWQAGKWVDLQSDPTVMYVPFNAGPDEPFGKSMLESAPLDVIRMLGVMHDFRRVLAAAGWARSDFTVDTEKLRDFMPPDAIGDVDAEDAFIQDFLAGINETYANLKPNEGYGHLDIVTVNMPKGGQLQTSFFGLVEGLMRLYDRRVGRATGSPPIKQHSNESVTETHAVEQRKDYRINIASIQATVAGVLSTLLGCVLRAEGRRGKVRFYFENTPDPQDIRTLALAEGVKIENLKKLKELLDMKGIDETVYAEALENFKSQKEAHSGGSRMDGTVGTFIRRDKK